MSQDAPHIVCSACGAVNRVSADKELSAGKCGKCGGPLASPEPTEITGSILEKLRARDEGAFVLDVWAPWCGPCRSMAPAYAEAAGALQEQARFFKLNSDEHNLAAASLGVRGIPALFVFKSGKMVAQQAGAMPAQHIVAWVQDALAT